MKNKSIWLNYDKKQNYKPLNHNINVDVLIIGGGITGLSSLYHLSDSNLNIALVEKNELAHGVTARTTGKITYLQDETYNKLTKYHGINVAKEYLNSQYDAINIIKKIIENNNIDCNFEKVKSYIYSNEDVNKLEETSKILKDLNVTYVPADEIPTKEKFNKVIYVNDTYVFHPLKYLYNLAKISNQRGASIYERTTITSINKENRLYICKTKDNYLIKAKYVIIATHYPYFLWPLLMPLKCYLEKSYIGAYRTNKNLKYSSISITEPSISTRYYQDNDIIYKLFLTNSHNISIKNNDKENFDRILKHNNPDYVWSNKDIITDDYLPLIGAINKSKTLLIGTGYNTWGMTNGSLAGKILADIILKNNNKYLELFNPLRKINLGKIFNFPLIIGSNIYAYTKSKLFKQKKWYDGKIIFTTKNGKKLAIYTDSNNKKHIVHALCPHLKCGLVFNEIEKTWDCPCHGSRFDIDGNSIEGPSNYNIRYNEDD